MAADIPPNSLTVPDFPRLPSLRQRIDRCGPFSTTLFLGRSDSVIASPKQPLPERNRDWYPYYAGFTEKFVAEVLREHVGDVDSLLDPWNGSGTTTAASAKQGLKATGVDISPALTVVARARLTPQSLIDSLTPLGAEILEAARRRDEVPLSEDMLSVWIRPGGVARLRSVQSAIHSVLIDMPERPSPFTIAAFADSLPLLACFYYSALFATTRDLVGRFRATNPTWLRAPETSAHRIAATWKTIRERFLDRVAYLSERLSIGEEASPPVPVSIRTASAAALSFASGSFGASVTSPPYATRIDYVQSVLPELAVLGATSTDVESLRRLSTGSPVVKGVTKHTGALRSRYGCRVLRSIRSHASKGSKAYYFPWMSNYLKSLQGGLLETDRVVAANGPICIIVQDSHYKRIHIDLQRIVTEIMASSKRRLVARQDFEVQHHMARRNPRARQHLATRCNLESLLVFR